MRLMLYCDNCLQACTEPGTVYPAGYFEDGEICPYCMSGHLHALFGDEVQRFRERWAGKLTPERKAQLLSFMDSVYVRYLDKADADSILAALQS